MHDPTEIAQLRNEVAKANSISALVNDEQVQEVLNGLLHGAQNDWVAATTADAREQLWLRARGVTDFIEALRTIIESGKMAAIQLEQIKQTEVDHE